MKTPIYCWSPVTPEELSCERNIIAPRRQAVLRAVAIVRKYRNENCTFGAVAALNNLHKQLYLLRRIQDTARQCWGQLTPEEEADRAYWDELLGE